MCVKKNNTYYSEEMRAWAEVEKKLLKDEPEKDFDLDEYVASVVNTDEVYDKQGLALIIGSSIAFVVFIISLFIWMVLS